MTHFPLGYRKQIPAIQKHLAAHNFARPADEAGDRHCRYGLAATAFPDKAKRRAFPDTERHVVDRFDDSRFGKKISL
jgi:hypothetical protein